MFKLSSFYSLVALYSIVSFGFCTLQTSLLIGFAAVWLMLMNKAFYSFFKSYLEVLPFRVDKSKTYQVSYDIIFPMAVLLSFNMITFYGFFAIPFLIAVIGSKTYPYSFGKQIYLVRGEKLFYIISKRPLSKVTHVRCLSNVLYIDVER